MSPREWSATARDACCYLTVSYFLDLSHVLKFLDSQGAPEWIMGPMLLIGFALFAASLWFGVKGMWLLAMAMGGRTA